MGTTTDYQGWTNYETWCVKLGMDNDAGNYEYWREQTRDAWTNAPANVFMEGNDKRAREVQSALAAILKDFFEEGSEGLHLGASVYADLLGAALDEVNWHEIAKALIDDEREHGTLEDPDGDDSEVAS